MLVKSGIMTALRSTRRCGWRRARWQKTAPSVGIGRFSAASVSTGFSVLEAIDRRADDVALPVAILAHALVAGCGDAALDMAFGKALQDAAFLLDLPELVPGRFAERVGQRLDAARAGCGIGDEIDMAFGGHDELRVAGNAAREAVRQAMRDRVRQHRDRIGAADRRREAGDRRAQDVGLGIGCRHHPIGRFGMDGRGRGRDRADLQHLAQSLRSALILAIDRNWSWSTLTAKPICGAA